MTDECSDRPLQVAIHEGLVLVFGPGPINLALSVETAERSAALLMQAAMAARLGKTGVVKDGAPVGDDIVLRALEAATEPGRKVA